MMCLLRRSMATSISRLCRGSCIGPPKSLLLFYRAPRNAQNLYKQERSPIDALIAQVIGQLNLSPVREEGIQVLLKLLLSALRQWRPCAVREVAHVLILHRGCTKSMPRTGCAVRLYNGCFKQCTSDGHEQEHRQSSFCKAIELTRSLMLHQQVFRRGCTFIELPVNLLIGEFLGRRTAVVPGSRR